MYRLPLFLILLLCGSTSCTKQSSPTISTSSDISETDISKYQANYRAYVIKKGSNYCSPNPFRLTTKSTLRFNAIFDSSCIYKNLDSINQQDINKLYGFSDCGSQHLVNSARIGWRWYNNELQLFAFVHNDGDILPETSMGTAPIGSIINCRISCKAGIYEFEVNGLIKTLPRHCSGTYTRYMLNPYFGGDEPSPQYIKIFIDQL